MHLETKQVAAHMREFGLAILGRAIADATVMEIARPFSHALTVVHAAHGAEIILKARIAEEHPLLFFSKLPSQFSTSTLLTVAELFEYGRSYDFFELPNLLWATTGYRLRAPERYQQFGKLRNAIAHFAVPNVDLPLETLRFCIEVVEPILDDFWGDSALPMAEEWDCSSAEEGYIREAIESLKIVIPACVRKRLTPPE